MVNIGCMSYNMIFLCLAGSAQSKIPVTFSEDTVVREDSCHGEHM